jgi:hypothetical protein
MYIIQLRNIITDMATFQGLEQLMKQCANFFIDEKLKMTFLKKIFLQLLMLTPALTVCMAQIPAGTPRTANPAFDLELARLL